jgi:diguanylate cyclase (GGDEF)-like protein
MKVLVAEDTAVILAIICEQLESMQHTVITAKNGKEVIELFKKAKPDLILMDINMPVMDGFEAVRKIRAIEAKGEWTPIILLTGMTEDEDLSTGIKAGADDYLTKPISPVVLEAKIHAMERIATMHDLLDKANQELARLSEEDALTGLANRRKFDDTLEKEWRRMSRTSSPLALILVDVDFFKPYNDGYGHQSGDACLKKITSTLSKCIRRPGDLVARYGGEEFGVILPETPLVGAMHVAELMCKTIEKLKIPHQHSQTADVVTISAGIAMIIPNKKLSPREFIKVADDNLYQAKHQGRNRVVWTDK